MKALIKDLVVVDVVADGDDYPAHPELAWVDCGAEVLRGWTYDGTAFSPPDEAAAAALDPVDI